MRSAARIAETFSLDPMVVLDADREEWLTRLAAYNVIAADEQKRNAAK